MPDYPTNVPAAGWYPDPSDAAQERWWGGVEWTHDVRPLAATMPAPVPVSVAAQTPEPVLASVPGGGLNPFAAIDAQETRQGFDRGSFVGAASDFSSFNTSFDMSSMSAAQGSFGSTTVNPSWYDADRRAIAPVNPSNGLATAGLVLSLVGANVVGIVFSILGLRKAREFERDGELPVGRTRARWGLGLGIASFVVSIAALVVCLTSWNYIWALYLDSVGSPQTSQSEQFAAGDDGSISEKVPVHILNPDGTEAPYNRTAMEAGFIAGFTRSTGTPPENLTCPDDVELFVGAVFTCTFSYNGTPHVVDVTFTSSRGEVSLVLDGVPVQQ